MIEQHDASDRATWLARRQKDVTASAIGCLLGVHDWISPYQLWGLKSGRLQEDPEQTPAMRRGRMLEDDALEILAEDRPNWKIEPGRHYFRDPDARIGATPDAFAIHPERGRGIVQIKTVHEFDFRRKWQDPDTREITLPLWIACQSILEAHLTDGSWACVGALVVGRGLDLHLIDVPIHAGLIARMRDEVAKFWEIVASGEEPPSDWARDADTLARIFPNDNGTEVDLSGDNEVPTLLDERRDLKRDAKSIADRLETIDTALKAKLGNHASAFVSRGRTFSWKSTDRRGYTVAPTTFRQFRVTDRGAA